MSALLKIIERAIQLRATPEQVEGPFFLADAPVSNNAITPGDTGDVIGIRGQVLSTTGMPISDALVHIWLADTKGVYDNQDADGNATAIAREDYRNRIRIKTSKRGAFRFTCLRPGNYPLIGERVEVRPGHIHAIVEAPGFTKLITQLYFQDDYYNEHDIDDREGFFQPELVVHLSPALPQPHTAQIQRGVFNFVLQPAA